MQGWLPSRREIAANLIAALALPAVLVVWNITEGESVTFVALSGLGALSLVLVVISLIQWILSPYRRRTLTGKLLLDKIDEWLRDNGYGRTPVGWQGFSHALIATYGGVNVWIGITSNGSGLTFAATRTEDVNDQPYVQALQEQPTDWFEMRYQVELELARFGAYYSITESPLSLSYWVNLPIDPTLSESNVIDRVDFVRRADRLVSLTFVRTATAVLLRPSTTQPNITDFAPTTGPPDSR